MDKVAIIAPCRRQSIIGRGKAKHPGIMRALGNGQENVSKCPLKYKGIFCNFGVWKFCKGHLQKCMPSLI